MEENSSLKRISLFAAPVRWSHSKTSDALMHRLNDDVSASSASSASSTASSSATSRQSTTGENVAQDFGNDDDVDDDGDEVIRHLAKDKGQRRP